VSVHVNLVDLTMIYRNADIPSVDELNLEVQPGSLFALLGPSGCGKTTTLKMVAGLLEPTSGDIEFDHASVVRVPAERRRVAMVFQKPLLFPNMSIGDNVAFGLRMRGVERATIKRRVAEMLSLVHLPGVETRRPGELSGGQEQRVSLARSLVTEPDVLMLDEPLSQLDANLRIEMRDLIRHVQHELGITTIFVTHDQEEAVMLADRIALMLDGRLLQEDIPPLFYERPRSMTVARFFGAQNFIAGRVAEGRFESDLGTFSLSYAAPSGPGMLTIRQEAIEIGPGPNAFEVTVRRSIYLGTATRVWVETGGVELQLTVGPGHRFVDGTRLTLRFPPERLWVIPDSATPA
jgi:ABC-type Fe3+/spermidine/putrescine transport system ATPase subunit